MYEADCGACIEQVEEEDNCLQDGTLIDLCGATLLWRSADGLAKSPVSGLDRERNTVSAESALMK